MIGRVSGSPRVWVRHALWVKWPPLWEVGGPEVIQVLPVWEWRVGKKKQGLGIWGGPGSRQEVASPGRVEQPDDKQAQGELARALVWVW